MPISVTLVDSKQKIAKQIADIISKEIDKFLVKVVNKIRPEVRRLIYEAIMASEEVQSLNGGKLQAELGVPDASARIKEILDVWIKSVDVSLSPAKLQNGLVRAGFDITAIRSDYSDVLSQSEAIYSTDAGTMIQWLEWLLLEGDRKIIKDFKISTDYNNLSRTGLGKIMVKSNKSSWGVPPEFAGFAGNNFVTRSLDTIGPKIQQLIMDTFK